LDSGVIDVVCGVVRAEDGRVFACRRAPGQSQAGLWELPGGKIEDGESPEAALRRELDEELGIDVEVGPPLASVDHDYGEFSIRLAAHPCRIVSGRPSPREHAELRWLSSGELSSLDWAPADRKLLAAMPFFGSA
jgi:8-oxo-dGTP diphosphatase